MGVGFNSPKKHIFISNKTGLQPVSRPVEWVHYLGGGVGVQSPFEAKVFSFAVLSSAIACLEEPCFVSFYDDMTVHRWDEVGGCSFSSITLQGVQFYATV